MHADLLKKLYGYLDDNEEEEEEEEEQQTKKYSCY